MANIQGKVALITGAKGGLGAAVTNAFLNAGATWLASPAPCVIATLMTHASTPFRLN